MTSIVLAQVGGVDRRRLVIWLVAKVLNNSRVNILPPVDNITGDIRLRCRDKKKKHKNKNNDHDLLLHVTLVLIILLLQRLLIISETTKHTAVSAYSTLISSAHVYVYVWRYNVQYNFKIREKSKTNRFKFTSFLSDKKRVKSTVDWSWLSNVIIKPSYVNACFAIKYEVVLIYFHFTRRVGERKVFAFLWRPYTANEINDSQVKSNQGEESTDQIYFPGSKTSALC